MAVAVCAGTKLSSACRCVRGSVCTCVQKLPPHHQSMYRAAFVGRKPIWRRHMLKLPALYASTLPPVNQSFFSLSHLSMLRVHERESARKQASDRASERARERDTWIDRLREREREREGGEREKTDCVRIFTSVSTRGRIL
jgi:hypothetical protein